MERHFIVITGPESSGKSELCKGLSEALKSPWTEEFARLYLEENGPKYDFEVLQNIYLGHLNHQAKAKAQSESKLLILDTDSINFKVWSERVFKTSFPLLDSSLKRESEHHYLLCYPDLEWEDDPLRENPSNRLTIFEEHRNWIEKLGRPYRIIKGQKEERLKNALDALQSLRILTD
jgi:nicotinamide riboside kinase